MTHTKDEALRMALEALESERPYLGPMPSKTVKAITAVRQALAAPVQPMKWGDAAQAAHPKSDPQYWPDSLKVRFMEQEIAQLRATPPAQRQPLTDEPFGYVSQHTTPGPFEWQFSKTFAGVYRDTATAITTVYTAPPAAPVQSCNLAEDGVCESVECNCATQPAAQTASVREKWLQAVTDKIEAELLSHRLSLHDEVDNVGTGFPLVDALCCGQSDLEIGRKEVKDIAEAVYHVLDASTRAWFISSPGRQGVCILL
jgi:hypothetical protein